MARVNLSTVKTVNIHQSKINVMKFDGTNNWKGMGDIEKFRTSGRKDLKES